MTRTILVMAALLLGSCAQGPGPGRAERAPDGQRVLRGFDGEKLERTASPSALVAEEIAFAQAAREDGQWTAFDDFAADDAVMFVPEMVRAKDWLSGRADPAAAVAWQPHRVIMSCDGRTGATTGAWQKPDGSFGYFTTIWHKPDKRGARWQWLLDHGDVLAQPRPEPDFIKTNVGQCRGGVPTVTDNPTPSPVSIEGRSDDRTIVWRATVGADKARTVSVDLWNGTSYDRLIEDRVAAPAAARDGP